MNFKKLTLLSFLIFLIFFAEDSFAVFSSDPEIPVCEIEKKNFTFRNPLINSDYKSDTSINVNYYGLDLVINYQPDLLTGIVSIQFTGAVNGISGVFFDLSNNLTVDSVLHDNSSLVFDHVMDRVNISLPSQINSGDVFKVKIYYHGVPVPTGFGSFIFGANGDIPSIWTLSEPFGSSDWFPCKNTVSDKADSSDVSVTCRSDLTAVSNGVLISASDNGNGTKTYSWHNSYPIAVYLISLAISDYSQYNGYFRYSEKDSMPVFNFIYPENLDGLKTQLDKTYGMLEFFSGKFGLYPFIREKYGHAEFGRIAGMEHQTVSSMGVFNDNIMAHELTHQWFGDKISCGSWENIWLNEGFATYGEALYNEYLYGKSGYDEFIKYRMADAKRATGSVYVQDVNSVSQIFNGDRSYAKGCAVLHMLRGITGDSVFFAILKSYSSDTNYAYKTAVTADFMNTAESVSGHDLDYFFSEWIYGENFPKYNVDWTTEMISSSVYNAKINILQETNTSPPFFTMPVNIKIFLQNGDTTFTVFNNSQYQSFDFTVKGKPINFRIDPDNLILKEVRGEDIIPVSFSLSQNFPNPFNPSTTITYQLGRPSFVSLKIYDITGREVRDLINGSQREGNYRIEFNSSGLASGVYFYKLEAGASDKINFYFRETKKMILLR
ncbi:MAG: T9SS type A sorting domain-containing protein [Bacteroidetes bacterium]|nr:T9SS type A sorting domain-containing protein [Bacteroidota bacterium]